MTGLSEKPGWWLAGLPSSVLAFWSDHNTGGFLSPLSLIQGQGLWSAQEKFCTLEMPLTLANYTNYFPQEAFKYTLSLAPWEVKLMAVHISNTTYDINGGRKEKRLREQALKSQDSDLKCSLPY